MIGRAAYDNPFMFAIADRDIFGDPAALTTREQVVQAMLPYITLQTQKGVRLHSITRHMMHLFHGQPGSRIWKRYLTENACKPTAAAPVVAEALALVTEATEIARQHASVLPVLV